MVLWLSGDFECSPRRRDTRILSRDLALRAGIRSGVFEVGIVACTSFVLAREDRATWIAAYSNCPLSSACLNLSFRASLSEGSALLHCISHFSPGFIESLLWYQLRGNFSLAIPPSGTPMTLYPLPLDFSFELPDNNFLPGVLLGFSGMRILEMANKFGPLNI
ncbi:hypothetical protein HID58_058146 [Brassica napus]|uniref:Uncharacterized protein n=1 Tax=Brassica napus TaxID=3708 RepID=A0ABQ7ZP64_BRANA|nr:hypothetical protein HID58_058146 [Brassica napus]